MSSPPPPTELCLALDLSHEALPLVHRVGELGEGIGQLTPHHKELEALRQARLAAVHLGQRAHLRRYHTQRDTSALASQLLLRPRWTPVHVSSTHKAVQAKDMVAQEVLTSTGWSMTKVGCTSAASHSSSKHSCTMLPTRLWRSTSEGADTAQK